MHTPQSPSNLTDNGRHRSDREVTESLSEFLDRLAKPRDYYSGTKNLLNSLPRELLAFLKTEDLSRDHVSVHHRFVLVVCLQGPAVVIVDGVAHLLSPRECVLVFPFQSHHYTNFGTGPNCWLFVTFEVDDDGALADLRGRRLGISDTEAEILRRIIESIEAYLSSNMKSHSAAADSRDAGPWMALLLRRFLTQERIEPDRVNHPRKLKRLERIVMFIHQNLGREMRLEDIAKKAHLSPSHLRKIFSEQMGNTVAAYIRQARVDRATGLLCRSELSIKEIGEQCGFNSPYAFSRTFRQVKGCSPRACRDAILGERPLG